MTIVARLARAAGGSVALHNVPGEGLTVTVYTRGEADSPPEKITHACVQMVLIN